MFKIEGKYTSAVVYATTCEEQCVSQIHQMVNHPAFTEPVVIMPDCHSGKGSVIGFTMPVTRRIVPNVVGVDIGCGMLGFKVRRPKMPLEQIHKAIQQRIPFGTNVRTKAVPFTAGTYTAMQSIMHQLCMNLQTRLQQKVTTPPDINEKWFANKCNQIGMDYSRAQLSVGTLGGGNHFIEFGESQTHPDYIWIVIHSGSRQFGEKVCQFHQHIAEARLEDFRSGVYKEAFENLRKVTAPRDMEAAIRRLKAEHEQTIKIPKGLEVLEGADMYNYMYDMTFAQIYASENRRAMMEEILRILGYLPEKPTTSHYIEPPLEVIETVHNYINQGDLVIRKGAVSATSGEKIIIPFNMRDGIWVCVGRGDPSWNYSAPHGAGRIMSRSKAKETLDPEVAKSQMEGIYTSHIPIDEAPDAYKSASEIKGLITATAGVVEEIRPIMNMKAS